MTSPPSPSPFYGSTSLTVLSLSKDEEGGSKIRRTRGEAKLPMSNQIEHLVSACLCGMPCRYDGKSVKDERMEKLVRMQKAIPVCPEILSGLSIPREAVEITEGDGNDVLSGYSSVISRKGEDVTTMLLRGAFTSLKIAKKFKIKTAWMKKHSPSCGCGWIRRKGRLVRGDGVTVALFKQEGIRVVSR